MNQVWASTDTVGLNSELSLNIHLMCMGAAMALANLDICTGSSESSLCHTKISTKIKCDGLFDFFFASAKLDML